MVEKKINTKGLGRGLSALLGEDVEVATAIADETKVNSEAPVISSDGISTIKEVNIGDLEVSPLQPRHTFDEENMKGMVESVKEKGILQPLLVRTGKNGKYEIIAGERRFRAATEAGINKVPVIIREFNDQEVLEVALIENLQRENLNAIEEAQGYRRLIEEFHHTQEDLAKVVGKSRSHVANTMRLLGLSNPLQDMLSKGELSAGHARALLNAKNPEELAKKVVSKSLSVRQTEKLAIEEGEKKSRTKVAQSVKKMVNEVSEGKKEYQKDDDIIALEQEIEKHTGVKASINYDGKGGELILFYDNLEQLDVLVQKLNREETDNSLKEWSWKEEVASILPESQEKNIASGTNNEVSMAEEVEMGVNPTSIETKIILENQDEEDISIDGSEFEKSFKGDIIGEGEVSTSFSLTEEEVADNTATAAMELMNMGMEVEQVPQDEIIEEEPVIEEVSLENSDETHELDTEDVAENANGEEPVIEIAGEDPETELSSVDDMHKVTEKEEKKE